MSNFCLENRIKKLTEKINIFRKFAWKNPIFQKFSSKNRNFGDPDARPPQISNQIDAAAILYNSRNSHTNTKMLLRATSNKVV